MSAPLSGATSLGAGVFKVGADLSAFDAGMTKVKEDAGGLSGLFQRAGLFQPKAETAAFSSGVEAATGKTQDFAHAAGTAETQAKQTGQAIADAGEKHRAFGGILDGAKGSLSSFGSMLGNVGQIAGGLALGQSALAMPGQLAGMVDKAGELASATLTLSRTTGMQADQSSALISIFEKYGVSTDGAVRSLGFFEKGLHGVEDASEKALDSGKGFAGAIGDLGIKSTDAAGNVRPMNDVLLDVAEKFASMPDGVDKTADAMALFGKSGKDLIPVLDLGREGMQAAEDQAHKMGLTLSGDNVQAFYKYSMASKESHEALEGLRLQIGVAVMPLMTAFAEGTSHLAETFNTTLMPALQRGIKTLEPLADVVEDLTEKGFRLLGSGVEWVGGQVESLAGRLEGPVLSIFGRVRDAVVTFKDALTGQWVDDERIRTIDLAFGALGETVGGLVRVAGDLIHGNFGGAIHELSDSARDILPTIEGIGLRIAGMLTGIDYRGLASSLWGHIFDFASAEVDMDVRLARWLVMTFQSINWTGAIRALWSGLLDVGKAGFTLGSTVSQWIGQELGRVDWSGAARSVWPGILNVESSAVDLGASLVGWVRGQINAIDWSSVAADFQSKLTGSFSGVDVSGTLGSLGSTADSLRPLTDFLRDTLIPVFSQIGGIVEEHLAPAFARIRETAHTLSEEFGQSLGPLSVQLGQTWTSVKPLAENLGIAFGAIVAVIGAVGGAGLIGAFSGLVGFFSGVLPGAFQALGGIVETALGTIRLIADTVTGVVTIVSDLIHGNWSQAWDDAKTLVGNVVRDIGSIIGGLRDTVTGVVKGLVDGVIGFFQGLYDALLGHSIIPDIVNGIQGAFSGLWTWIQGEVSQWSGRFLGFFRDLPGDARTLFDDLSNRVEDDLSGLWSWVDGEVSQWGGRFVGFLSSLPGDVEHIFQDLHDREIAVLSDAWTWVSDHVSLWSGDIVGYISDLPDRAFGVFDSMRQQAENSLATLESSIQSTVSQWGGKIAGWIGDVPAKVGDVLTTMTSSIDSGFATAENHIWTTVTGWGDKIHGWINDIPDKMSEVASRAASAFGSALDTIYNIVLTPINAVIGLIDSFVGGVNGLLSDVGSSFQITPLQTISGSYGGSSSAGGNLGSGGAMSAHATGARVDAPEVANIGEDAPAWPEYVIPTNPAYRGRAVGLMRELAGSLGVRPRQGWGGLASVIGGAVSSIGSLAGDLLHKVEGYLAEGAEAAVSALEDFGGLDAFAGLGKDLASGAVSKVEDAVTSLVSGIFDALKPKVQAAQATGGGSSLVTEAQTQLGQTRSGTYDSVNGDHFWAGWCEAFVESVYQHVTGTRFTADSAQSRADSVPLSTSWPPPVGAQSFWNVAPYGHTMLSQGDGSFIGTQGSFGDTLPIAVYTPGLPFEGWTPLLAASTGGGLTSGSVGGGVDAWIDAAIAAMGVDPGWHSGLATIISYESGGDPLANSADNPGDLNTIAGNPTIGLTQQLPDNNISGTYGQNSIDNWPAPLYTGGMPLRYGFDLVDGVQNIEAGIEYILGRYGSVWNVPGIVSLQNGGRYIGYDDGGLINEHIVGLGDSGTVYQFGEGQRPERVTPGGSLAGGVVVNLTMNIARVDGAFDLATAGRDAAYALANELRQRGVIQ